MNFRQRFFRFIESIAIPHLALYIVMGQVLAFIGIKSEQVSSDMFVLVPNAVLAGQWWRLVSYIFEPPSGSIAFVLLGWWVFYFFANSLETHWGAARFTLFMFLGWLFTAGAAFLMPGAPTSNLFIGGSVFLAFAYVAPEFELLIYFVLPVKAKWLALFTWCTYGYYFVTGGWPTRLAILASVGNFFVFFGGDILGSINARNRRAKFVAKAAIDERAPHNRCRICGRDSNTNPELDFRYCSKCAGEQCYCSEHLANHQHVVADVSEKK